ncbi:MAG: DUF1592 domain-containing protein [Fimbriiglobus sp.]
MRCFALLLFILFAAPVWAGPTGKEIYVGSCAKCHGAKGEGVKGEYDQPLAGNRSVPQLAKYIAKSMPPDNPGSLSAPDAESVSKFIYDEFYSKEAQERNKPPRVELARLTVNQYRLATYDLLQSMSWSAPWGDKRGLKGEYFASRGYRKEKRVQEKIDPQIAFDFDKTAPHEKLDPVEFSIYWFGSVMPPETGEYEFIVQSDQAVVLFVNKERVIDRWVKSGDDSEFRASVFLVGSRPYALQLDFSKAKQGVQNDPNKDKPKALKPARVALYWKRPGQPEEVIPSRFLSNADYPTQFALTTPFPPDDRSYGWERGTTISKEWEAATTEGAIETTNYVLKNLDALSGTNDKAADRLKKIQAMTHKFAERAFRRPLTDVEKRIYVDRHYESYPKDVEQAVKRIALLVLKSPKFLYRETSISPEPFAVASRLSFALWDSIPDQELWNAAAQGRLKTPEQIRAQAERLSKDPRAEAKLRSYLVHWLGLDVTHDISKNSQRFPGFDAVAVKDLKTSLELSLQDILMSPEADYRKLFTDDGVYINKNLAKIYSAKAPNSDAFEKVALNPNQRVGIVAHPYILTNFAYAAESSPIHRGVFLSRGILGQTLKPPMEAFSPLAADLHPKLTTRERTELQTGQRSCQACHSMINSLGFALEKYDAIGRFRGEENGKPINDAGSYVTRTGETAKFTGAAELSKFLMNSPEVQESFAEQLFHHLVQQPIRAYGPSMVSDLRQTFQKQEFNLRKLAVEIAVTGTRPKPSPTAQNPVTPGPKGQ